MSNNAGYIVKVSRNTPPASDEHSKRALKDQDQEVDQQTRTQGKLGTDLQYQPGLSGNEPAASYVDGKQSQIDGIIAHDHTSTTRNATHTHDHHHVTSGHQVDDTTPLNVIQTVKESFYALDGIASGQNDLLAVDGCHNHLDTISGGQVQDDAAPAKMQTLHDNTCVLVGGCSGQPASQADGTREHIETSPSVNDLNNAAPAILTTFQDQAYALVGASSGLTTPQAHRNLNHQKTLPDIHSNVNNNPSMVATLQDQAYALIQGPVEVFRKDCNADSHELAYDVPKTRGAIQTDYPSGRNAQVARDIGWHKANVEIPDPLIGGYTNEELFAFLRRFNKDVFDVKAVPIGIASGLDLNDAWSQDHTTDKVSLHLQRVYLTMILGIASLGKHVSRLRSWKETRRTSAFCAIYFSAWLFDLLAPLVLGTLILLVSSVEARNALFPPAPRALVNIRTGGIQKPQAGQLGTNDTLTGAPEKQPYEAIEEEAANFVDNVRHNIQRAVGMHNNSQRDGDPLEGKVPKPIRAAVKAVQGAGSAPGHVTKSTDQTQQPMEEIIWAGVNPESITRVLDTAPHVIGEIADNWERVANALSPTPPFSRFAFLRINAVLATLFLVSIFINYYMVYKGTGCAIGFVIFGDPMLTPAIAWLKQNMPYYMDLAQPKNNVLRGVPTNTQIAITLLRIGEAHNTPLPPVPTSMPVDPDRPNLIHAEDIPLDATQPEVLDAVMPSAAEKAHSDDSEEQPKHKHLSKFIRLFKGHAKSVVETKLATDHVRAATGSQKAKGHLGVLPKTKSIVYAGPSEYKCRFEGKSGWAVITESAGPILFFTRDDPRPRSSKKLKPAFEIAVKDMKRLKRTTAFVNTAIESMAAFSSEKELLASLEIEDEEEKTWRLTAIPERDELFNRLISIGNQRWENL
ncbi:hypothetical protein N7510_005234 [Penicillium lagena]|uniref:uncharacterized protein n=1 Tax=Penicillium lagena TaxID=94218 RepID=UPI00254040D7|nr:uncharacterized protein N7510_005234 [Penicillium lagena]KAJ5612040.1 hypothetical protein N7510_005234 [Penicillium lagena]